MSNIPPSEYFLQALEAQRAINTHIHEIEPSTPIFLYEIDLNEIRPATITYPNTDGPIRDGVLRIHNDFNLFNVNRGIIKWKGNLYFPFPIYGEQFDITSNGTIPTPKVKFSSQFLDDEYNSFYKYIRMQINELKDIVGSKVTRRKTFVRYLSADNFEGNVNPFNNFAETPWASRDGDVLTARSITRVPTNFSKWIIYYPKPNYGSKLKIFTSLRTDDKIKTLDSEIQIQNYHIESTDFFSLYVDGAINNSLDVPETFTVDIFAVSGNNSNYTKIIPEQNKEYKKIGTSTNIKVFCGNNSNDFTPISSFATSTFPITFSENANELVSFLSLKANSEAYGQKFKYNITDQTQSGFTANFSELISGNLDFNYLTIPTGAYTGTNPYSNEATNFTVLKFSNNFGTVTSGEYNLQFPVTFHNVPKILFRAESPSGFIFNQYLKNISNTGCTFVVNNTGSSSYEINDQTGFLMATDYIYEESTPTGATQVFSSSNNLAAEYLNQIDYQNTDPIEVELTPDVFYIDRKIQEDSTNVVYELASLLDVEGVKLPSRILLSKNCPFTYRGEGCCYEKGSRLTKMHSGIYGEVIGVATHVSGADQTVQLPLSPSQQVLGLESAPPVSDSSNKSFGLNEVNSEGVVIREGYGFTASPNWRDVGTWNQGNAYFSGNYAFIEKNEIKYYFVCIADHSGNALNAPPNTNYWISDTCSKTLKGCKLRWKENPNFSQLTISGVYEFTGYSTPASGYVMLSDPLIVDIIKAPKDAEGNQLIGVLPFGGFPSVEGKYQSQQGPQG